MYGESSFTNKTGAFNSLCTRVTARKGSGLGGERGRVREIIPINLRFGMKPTNSEWKIARVAGFFLQLLNRRG